MAATTDAQLRYEPLAHAHADALVTALADVRVATYIGGPTATTEQAIRERIERVLRGPVEPGEHWLNFVVRRAADGVVIGWLEATVYDDGWAEIAYVFGAPYWGHGYATEGLHWLIDELGTDEIWAAVHPDNARSIALLLRLGFARRDVPARPLGSYDPGDVAFERK
ncbi:MAG TPA: GNAT family N-acetyltransferase [Kofleriaceae bacterium]|nr:GNAT family N-acetyltransferase [Kofleriaceae bacterium]